MKYLSTFRISPCSFDSTYDVDVDDYGNNKNNNNNYNNMCDRRLNSTKAIAPRHSCAHIGAFTQCIGRVV